MTEEIYISREITWDDVARLVVALSEDAKLTVDDIGDDIVIVNVEYPEDETSND